MPFVKATLFTLLLCISVFSRADDRQTVDLIVEGDFVLTMNEDEAPIKDGAVVILGTTIIEVTSRELAHRQFKSPKIVSGHNRVVLPGLINGHTHSAMTLFRGMADDLDLMSWLNDYVFPMEQRFVTPDFVRIGSKLACWEMIRTGTTTFVDMYFYPDEIAKVVDSCGLRAILGAPHIDYPSPGFEGWDDSFKAARQFVQDWQDRHPRIRPAFAPHAPYTVSAEHLSETVSAAESLDALITIHLSEAATEVAQIQEAYGNTPVRHVDELGLLKQKVIAAHMVELTDADILAIAKAGVGTVHNPTSNLKVAAGISPVPKLLEAGISVVLGTDGAASNNDLDLWEEIRLAALLHKGETGDPTAVKAETALALATRFGAKAIRWQEEIGTIESGKQADIIQVEFGKTQHLPLYDIVSHLVYVLDSDDVTTSIVAGKILMEDKRITTIDEAALRKAVTEAAGKIRRALEED